MRLPFPLRLERRRGLLVYQLVLILIGIIILILVLLYIARRHQIGASGSSAERVPRQTIFAQRPGSFGAPLSWVRCTSQSERSRPT
jgi:hypothetical protein